MRGCQNNQVASFRSISNSILPLISSALLRIGIQGTGASFASRCHRAGDFVNGIDCVLGMYARPEGRLSDDSAAHWPVNTIAKNLPWIR